MARRKDAEEDRPSRTVLDQLNTKTVGAPPSSTGLTGDQLPETVFKIADFDQVKNQVTLQLSNLELLNVLNTVGQITNTQSQSGPLVGTAIIKSVTHTSTGSIDLFAPTEGTWLFMVASKDASVTGDTNNIRLYYGDGSTSIWFAVESGTIDAPFDVLPSGPVYIDGASNPTTKIFSNCQSIGAGQTITVSAAFVRVR